MSGPADGFPITSSSLPPDPSVLAPTPASRRKIVFRLLGLLVSGVALYLVLPGLLKLFGSLPQLEAVFPAWFVPIFVLMLLGIALSLAVRRAEEWIAPWKATEE